MAKKRYELRSFLRYINTTLITSYFKSRDSNLEKSRWGGQRDLNSQPPLPQRGALTVELWPPRKSYIKLFYLVIVALLRLPIPKILYQ